MNWAPAYLLLSLLIQAPPEPLAVAAAHLDAGRYAEAIAVLKPLAEKDPKDLVAHFDLALAYSMAGQSEPAIAGFRRVLELKPGLYEAQLNLGQLLEKSGQHAEAAEWLSQAVEQKPKDLRPVLLLGRALAGQSKWNDAVAALEKAAALDAADKDIQLELAQVCERAGQPDKALAIYARFADDAAVQEHRGLMLMARGDNEGARGALEAALVKSPSAALRYALATVYLRLKQPQKSVPLAAQMVEAEPANYDLRMFYGRLLRDQMQYAAAATQFAAAVKVRPDSGEAWNELTGNVARGQAV